MAATTIHLPIGGETVVTTETDTIILDGGTTALYLHGRPVHIERLIRHLNREACGETVRVDKDVLARVYEHLGRAGVTGASIEFEDYEALGDALGVTA